MLKSYKIILRHYNNKDETAPWTAETMEAALGGLIMSKPKILLDLKSFQIMETVAVDKVVFDSNEI